MANVLLTSAVLVVICVTVLAAYDVKQPAFMALSPKGLQISYVKDDPNLRMVAFHFSINQPVHGVEVGKYNADVKDLVGDVFIYIQPDIELKPGDVVFYWVFCDLGSVGGYTLTDQQWICQVEVPTTTAPPTTIPPTEAPLTSTPAPYETTKVTKEPPTVGPTTPRPDCDDDKPKCTEYPCLIFEDTFDKFNMKTWKHEITAGGGGNWEFQYYYNNRSNSFIKDGVLHIRPTLTEERFGENTVAREGAVLDLWGADPSNLCTGNQWWGCERTTNGRNIINPIQSASIRTAESFSFRYGRLEIRAKLPKGDWIWPGIWLLPRYQEYGIEPASGAIHLVDARANADLRDDTKQVGINQFSSSLHFGPYSGEDPWQTAYGEHNLPGGQTFNDHFHVFRMDWDKDGFIFKVDDTIMLQVPTADGYWARGGFGKKMPEKNNPWVYGGKDAPFDQEYYIILKSAVGGIAYFADHFVNANGQKPWAQTSDHAPIEFWEAKERWFPTWPLGEDRDLQIDYIRVWKMTEAQDQ